MTTGTYTLVALLAALAAVAIVYFVARSRRPAPAASPPSRPKVEPPREPIVDQAVANILATATTQAGDRRTNEEMVDDALRIVTSLGGVSVPALQRKLKIDFQRATELVALLEERSYISAPTPGHKRKVLPAAFERVEALEASE
jgi:hypothetical protein